VKGLQRRLRQIGICQNFSAGVKSDRSARLHGFPVR
jgi:hypothetical protein